MAKINSDAKGKRGERELANELLKQVADKVRIFYARHPELLEEALERGSHE